MLTQQRTHQRVHMDTSASCGDLHDTGTQQYVRGCCLSRSCGVAAAAPCQLALSGHVSMLLACTLHLLHLQFAPVLPVRLHMLILYLRHGQRDNSTGWQNRATHKHQSMHACPESQWP